MKIFFDTEFTKLHKNTTLISIGLVDEDEKTFYWECTDYDRSQIDNWLKENVISNLRFNNMPFIKCTGANVEGAGDKETLKVILTQWLSYYDDVEMWSDVGHYDWVLFCDIFGDAFSIPKNIHYICYDIATLMKCKGLDPDIDRNEFTGFNGNHNALSDAFMAMECYYKTMNSFQTKYYDDYEKDYKDINKSE